MKRIIINADDCGRSIYVDSYIEEAIKLGKISSTTIMTNMEDFVGALRLYREFKDVVSFGWHINLDEGQPLTRSQLLLDKGFFIEKDGQIVLNGKAFRKRFLDPVMRVEIKKELRAQYEMLLDNGIVVSHADSHHFYHTQPSMITVIPSFLKEIGIIRCRCVSNYNVSGISSMARNLWAAYFKWQGFIMPDTFCSYSMYYENPSNKQGQTIELMCHPGHDAPLYRQEYERLLKTDVKQWGAKLITYWDL